MDIQITITNPSVAVIRALAEAVNQSIDAPTITHTEVAATNEASSTVSAPDEPSGEKESPADAAPQTDKPKRQRKPQPEKSEPEGAPDAKTEPETEEPPQTESPAPTIVELRAKAQEVGTSPEAKKAIKALLDKFGSKSLSEVSEDKRAEFLAGLAAIPGKLAEGEDA